MPFNLKALTSVAVFFLSSYIYADDAPNNDCILNKLQASQAPQSYNDLKILCKHEQSTAEDTGTTIHSGALSQRIKKERSSAFNPFVITPHRRNYILPVLFTDNINSEQYSNLAGWPENLERTESKFQLSLKVPINSNSWLIEGDTLYFGFTIEAWWQVYSDNISKPFRETNYRPELFYAAPLNWHPWGSNTGFSLGIEHQSNGRSQVLSRSWNRVFAEFVVERNNFALSFRPWWRIPEDDKEFPLDSKGDDNPDIHEFLGYHELTLAHKWRSYELSMMTRYNFGTHNGSVKLGFTFPLWNRFRGYVQYFSGYGESLIDYNHKQQRLGLGIALTDLL